MEDLSAISFLGIEGEMSCQVLPTETVVVMFLFMNSRLIERFIEESLGS